MNTVYWVLVAFGIVVLEARLRARNVRYLPILPAIVLGAVLSKVTYVVLHWHYAFPHWGWGAFTVLRPDTFCFFGGAVGVVLGVIISAKLTHQRVLPVLDAFAPAGALLVDHLRGLGHGRVRHEGGLDLGGGQAVAGDVHDVVHTAENPEVAVGVQLGAVPGEVFVAEA